jgi:hypothetical protein
MPMTVLVEAYWREIAEGLAGYGVEVRHVVLHARQDVLRERIERAAVGSSPFRLAHLDPYAEAARTWLHAAADVVVDTTHLAPTEVAQRIARTMTG